MLPTGGAIVLLLLALVPGWCYLRLRERLQPPSGTAGIHELLEVLAVGLATTGTAAVVLTLVPSGFFPFIVDIDQWAIEGAEYLRSHPRLAVYSAVSLLALALIAAYGLYRLHRWNRHAEFRSSGNVLVHSLGARPKGKVPFVGLQLDDGTLVEGVLHSYNMKDASLSEHEIAVQRPIRVTPHGSSKSYKRDDIARLIVPGRLVSHITVIHIDQIRTKDNRRD